MTIGAVNISAILEEKRDFVDVSIIRCPYKTFLDVFLAGPSGHDYPEQFQWQKPHLPLCVNVHVCPTG